MIRCWGKIVCFTVLYKIEIELLIKRYLSGGTEVATIWSKIKRAIKDPCTRFGYMRALGLTNVIPDKRFLEKEFYFAMHKKLNVEDPKTFNEKLQWLKLYNHDPKYTDMVDKYRVRQYIREILGEQYLIPLVGVWNDPEEIDFRSLPDQFVLKCNHNSGTGMCICNDKERIDSDKVKRKLRKGLKENYYLMHREWPYKNVTRRIVAEQYMADELRDYKALGFDSTPYMKLVYSVELQEKDVKEFYFGENDFSKNYMMQHDFIKKLSIELAAKISLKRIDFYQITDNTYLGEITFISQNGIGNFRPEEWNLGMGDWTQLSNRVGSKLKNGEIEITFCDSKNRKAHTKALVDYKFFCFDGFAESVMVCTERETGQPKYYFFDKNWELKKYNIRGKEAPKGFTLPKPECIDEMFNIAEKLSKDLPYVRVDLYCIDNLIYFGEMTFFPDSGFDANLLKETDTYWGGLVNLPEKRI